jgi:ubiquinone/menaquinone biosynthesis C-methylase UbiE
MADNHPHGMARAKDDSVKDAVQRQFSQVAANYSTSSVHASGAELEKMVQMANLQGAEMVLDAGCGPGHAALAFAPHAAKVVAVDLVGSMLEQGRALAAARGIANIEFRQADVEQLPFEAESFDVIATRYSAHHWPDPQAALREFHRVLRRPDGREGQLLIVDVVSFDDPVIDTHLQAIELLRDPSHVRDHTAGQWMTMLAVAGFQAEVDFTWNLHIEFSAWVQRMLTPPPAVAMIRSLLDHAPAEVRYALQVKPDSSFTLRCALLRAVHCDL